MSQFVPIKLIGTTNASGALTLTATQLVNGELGAVQWVDGDLADGVDAVLSVTSTDSGVDYTLLTLTNADNDAFYLTRAATSDATGAASLYAAGGTAVNAKIPVVGRLQLVISDGGDTKTGGAIVFVEC